MSPARIFFPLLTVLLLMQSPRAKDGLLFDWTSTSFFLKMIRPKTAHKGFPLLVNCKI